MDFRQAVRPYAEEPLTLQLLMGLLKEYKRPFDKIHELVKAGQLLAVKKGLYVLGPALDLPRPESFLLANHLWGPSYVSLESALSYWGLIPERVFETTSVTTKSSKTYKTPAGRFSYYRAPLPYYAFGIQSVALSEKQQVLIASPEKALCDKVVMTSGVLLRSTRQVHQFLEEDLRIGEERLRELNPGVIDTWTANAPKTTSLQMLVKTLQNL
jgi:hypothetical protein